MLASTAAGAQSTPPVVTAGFSADTVLIGDQFRLEVKVAKDVSQVVDFPRFKDSRLGGPFEILSESLDTLEREGRRMVLRKSYLLTVFDAGQYKMDSLPVLYVDKNIVDTLHSQDSLRIVVNTLPVDTLTQTIVDIKKPLETPFVWAELKRFGWWFAAGIGLLALLAFGIWYYIRRRKRLPVFSRPRPADPPHVAAIKALEKVYHEKLWQNHKYKQYYTRITDIVREYIEQRYGINAMEQTSDQILGWLDQAGFLAPRDRQKLAELFGVADLVKFAKYVPAPETNEMAYDNAYFFVEETKPAAGEAEEKDKKEGEA